MSNTAASSPEPLALNGHGHLQRWGGAEAAAESLDYVDCFNRVALAAQAHHALEEPQRRIYGCASGTGVWAGGSSACLQAQHRRSARRQAGAVRAAR